MTLEQKIATFQDGQKAGYAINGINMKDYATVEDWRAALDASTEWRLCPTCAGYRETITNCLTCAGTGKVKVPKQYIQP